MERWATFDCYGTLIDWNGGIRGELARVFGEDRADERLARYHQVQPELQAARTLRYPEGFTPALARPPAPDVAPSLYPDMAPASELGLPSIWINRLGELPEPRPTRELRDLDHLPETLDELAPA